METGYQHSSEYIQASGEAIIKKDYNAAFSFLKKGIETAKDEFSEEGRYTRLIVELMGVIVLLEGSLKETLSHQWIEKKDTAPKEMGKEKCSFCGKLRSEVLIVVAGPSVFICNECIKLCSDIVAEKTAPPDPSVEEIDSKEE